MIRSDRCYINAIDARKRQQIASKAFSEGQPANPQARASSNVGCFFLYMASAGDQRRSRRFSSASKGRSRGRSLLLCFERSTVGGSARSNPAGSHVRAVHNDVYLPSAVAVGSGIDCKYWNRSSSRISCRNLERFFFLRFGARRCRTFWTARRSISQRASVSHLRWFRNGIFKLALSDGLVPAIRQRS